MKKTTISFLLLLNLSFINHAYALFDAMKDTYFAISKLGFEQLDVILIN